MMLRMGRLRWVVFRAWCLLVPRRGKRGKRGRRWSEEVDLGLINFSWTMGKSSCIQQISGPTSFSVPAFSVLPSSSNQIGISRCSFSIRAETSRSSDWRQSSSDIDFKSHNDMLRDATRQHHASRTSLPNFAVFPHLALTNALHHDHAMAKTLKCSALSLGT